MAELTYLQAISDGLRLEMRRDKRVYVIGEDVGVYGGAFKVTLGFQEEFGAWRVIDAPLSETAIVGSCTGAALMGLRPVCEMQFADFVSCAWDQLVTVAAKQFYRAGTPVPIVVRLPSGGGFSGGPFHSQNPESSFAHIPGLKCVCPATPEDAKGLLAAAIEDPNPVLYFEHKHLYRRIKADVPEERYTTPIGKARTHREGEDISVITWGAMVYTADEAAQELEQEDVSVEVIDLRSVQPWDKDAVLESVRKTSKVLVLHEDTRTGGFGAEIAATIAEEAFESPGRAGEADHRARHAGAVLAAAREGVHPAGRRRRRGAPGAGGVLMATGTAIDVVMPQMGVSVSEGTVTKWLRNEGEAIEADEPLLEISTDKVDTEVPSPGTGVVQKILVAGGRDRRGRHQARGDRAGRLRRSPTRSRPSRAAGARDRRGRCRGVGAFERRDARSRSADRARAGDRRRQRQRQDVRLARSSRGSRPSTASTSARCPAPARAAVSPRRTSWRSSSAARRRLLPPPSAAPAAPAAAAPPAPAVPQQPPSRQWAASRSSRCRRCARASPSTCAARSTPPRT